jgi:hypothetical protein
MVGWLAVSCRRDHREGNRPGQAKALTATRQTAACGRSHEIDEPASASFNGTTQPRGAYRPSWKSSGTQGDTIEAKQLMPKQRC